LKVAVGELLRLKRVSNKNTLSDIAGKVGVSPNYISEIEKGIKSNPSDEIVVKLAKVFELNEDDLFTAFKKVPLSVKNEVTAHPNLVKAISQLNSDPNLSHEQKEQFYEKLVYWYDKLADEF
jgi:transcriptional regulator with XRE-family HTH domain